MQISCSINANDGTFFYYLYDKFVKFEPQRFYFNRKGKLWNTKHVQVIKNAGAGDVLSFSDKNRNILSINVTGSDNPHQSITIEQDSSVFYPENKDIDKLISNAKGFTSVYLYNEEYTSVHSSESETLFNYRNISTDILDTIKKTPFKMSVFDDRRYDTRFNPGRQLLIGHTWLMAAWKMWFGKDFFKIVPKEKLLNFKYASQITELPGGGIFIQLFDKMEESHSIESMFRQWKWQSWLDFDELEKKYT